MKDDIRKKLEEFLDERVKFAAAELRKKETEERAVKFRADLNDRYAAKANLNKLKHEAHKHFDRIWRSEGDDRRTRNWRRTRAYELLAKVMNLPRCRAHMKMMNEEQCRRVIEIFKPYGM